MTNMTVKPKAIVWPENLPKQSVTYMASYWYYWLAEALLIKGFAQEPIARCIFEQIPIGTFL